MKQHSQLIWCCHREIYGHIDLYNCLVCLIAFDSTIDFHKFTVELNFLSMYHNTNYFTFNSILVRNNFTETYISEVCS